MQDFVAAMGLDSPAPGVAGGGIGGDASRRTSILKNGGERSISFDDARGDRRSDDSRGAATADGELLSDRAVLVRSDTAHALKLFNNVLPRRIKHKG